MQTVGHLLQQARLKKKLTLTQLSQLTKIPPTTLKALEKNQFHRLPSAPYIKGFIKNYAQALNLNPTPILAIFRRDFHKTKPQSPLPQGITQPLNSSSLKLTFSKNLALLLLILTFLLTYLGFSVYQLYQPPSLVLYQPQSGQELSPPILVKGKTDHDASLSLNGKTINLESDGSFTTVFSTPPGAAQITLQATSRRSRTTQITRHFIVKPN